MHNGIIQLPLSQKRIAEIILCFGVIGFDDERLLEMKHGVVHLTFL